jgi:hypothetical protein
VRQAQLEREREQVLLRALVQLALEPAPRLVGGLDEPPPRLGVARRLRDELGERASRCSLPAGRRLVAWSTPRAPPHLAVATTTGAASARACRPRA